MKKYKVQYISKDAIYNYFSKETDIETNINAIIKYLKEHKTHNPITYNKLIELKLQLNYLGGC